MKGRFHVHITVTDDFWAQCNPVITVTLDAPDEDWAEINARALMPAGMNYDICEIEEAA